MKSSTDNDIEQEEDAEEEERRSMRAFTYFSNVERGEGGVRGWDLNTLMKFRYPTKRHPRAHHAKAHVVDGMSPVRSLTLPEIPAAKERLRQGRRK